MNKKNKRSIKTNRNIFHRNMINRYRHQYYFTKNGYEKINHCDDYFYFEFEDAPTKIRKSLIFNSKYYILCNVENLTPKSLKYIHRVQPKNIPIEIESYTYNFEGDQLIVNDDIKKITPFVVDKFTYWLNVKTIFYILSCGDILNPINNKFKGWGKLYLNTENINKKWIDSFKKENKLICSDIKYVNQSINIL